MEATAGKHGFPEELELEEMWEQRDREVADLTQEIRSELQREAASKYQAAISKYRVGQLFEKVFKLRGRDNKSFEHYLSESGLSMSLRHSRNYRSFFKYVKEGSQSEGVTPEQYLQNHPEVSTFRDIKPEPPVQQPDESEHDEPTLPDTPGGDIEGEGDETSEKTFREPADRYTSSDHNEMSAEDFARQLNQVFANIFGTGVKDELDLASWGRAFTRLKEGLLPVKGPKSPKQRVAA